MLRGVRGVTLVAVCAAFVLAVPASAAEVDPKLLVLQRADVPSRFVFDPSGSERRPNGYAARYVHRASDTGVVSEANVFRRPEGARMLLRRVDAYWKQYLKEIKRTRAGIGAESWMYEGSIDTLVAWRYGRVSASVWGIGLDKEQTLALARKQQRRIVAAFR